MSKTENKKLNINLSTLIRSNKFLLGFSIVAAFVLWLWVSIEKSPVIENTIVSIPVQIDLEESIPSQMGLRIFGNTNYTVDVTVSGKKFIVSSLTAEDIKVVAQTNYVDSAGNKTLTLKATNDSSKDFTIKSLSQNYISVYFDFYKEAEFALTTNIETTADKMVIDGCFLGDPILSKTTVKVNGPSTEINKISGVSANYVITETLDATTTVNPEIELTGATSGQLTNTTVDVGESVITMTIPVLKEMMLPTSVSFRNAPAYYVTNPMGYSVYPSSVKVGVPVEQIDQIDSITVGTIDFSEIDAGNNSFNFTAESVTDYMIMDHDSNFRVSVIMNNCTSKTLTVPAANISIVKQNSAYNSQLTANESVKVRVIGPADILAGVTEKDIKADIDLSEIELNEGINNVSINFTVNSGNSSCWVFGEHSVTVTAQKA